MIKGISVRPETDNTQGKSKRNTSRYRPRQWPSEKNSSSSRNNSRSWQIRSHEIKQLCRSKGTINILTRQTEKWENIFVSYSSKKRFISKMDKEPQSQWDGRGKVPSCQPWQPCPLINMLKWEDQLPELFSALHTCAVACIVICMYTQT